jgi:hypothetical protein
MQTTKNTTAPADDGAVEQSLIAILSASQTSSPDTKAYRQQLESKLDGPSGVVSSLLRRVWLPTPPSPSIVQGDHAVAVLSHLVELYPNEYMATTSQCVRDEVERQFPTSMDTDDAPNVVSDALLAALTKLLIAPNSDNQVGTATNVNAALLHLCQYDHNKNNRGRVAQRLFSALHVMWRHIQQNAGRELSSGQIRIASLMIDVCLLGDVEFSYILLEEEEEEGKGCIMNKLLHLALDMPNDDPLLQMSALDQLERLSSEPVQRVRAEFLLGSDLLRAGLLCLVGGDVTDGEMDPVNGPAALRLLTEICRVGVSSSLSLSIEESEWEKFHSLLKGFHIALQQFHPQGELERLSFIHAVSSLFGSCSIMACNASAENSSSRTELINFILRDKVLLHDWLSLHTRVSQPKLKSAVLCSIAQVLEPATWNDESGHHQQIQNPESTCIRPNDAIALQLYQAFSEANSNRDATKLLLASAKSPFVEERLGAYTMLKALVMRGATLQLLLLHNDENSKISFLVWLLNQDNESTTEGRVAKYNIVNTMMSRSGSLIRGLIPDKLAKELQIWNNIGPHYAKSIPWEMATE